MEPTADFSGIAEMGMYKKEHDAHTETSNNAKLRRRRYNGSVSADVGWGNS